MSLLLPPCIESLVSDLKEDPDPEAVEVVASYMRDSGISTRLIHTEFPELAEVLVPAMTKPGLPGFSCDFVASKGYSDKCNMDTCPFLAVVNPVSFVLDRVERITYNPLTKELKLYFPRVPVPLVVPTGAVSVNRPEVEASISTYMLEVYGVYPSFHRYRDDDGVVHDPLRDLIVMAFKRAEMKAEDEVGVAEVLTTIISNHAPVPMELASVLSDMFIYINGKGERYLAISTRVMRTHARQLLGVHSVRKLSKMLTPYNIEKKRIRLQGERAYYYLVPERQFKELTGMDLGELPSLQQEEMMLDMGVK